MTRRTQIRANVPTPTLNKEEFEALTDLLYEAVKGNRALISRLLGIDKRTWDKWLETPPLWPWWNLILRHVIVEVLAHLRNKKGITAKHRNRVLEALSRIPKSDELIDVAELAAYEYIGAEAHLRRLLTPRGKWWSDIRLAANSNGYTQKTLRIAAKKLGVIKTQEGFGKDKDSYWRLPDQDDD